VLAGHRRIRKGYLNQKKLKKTLKAETQDGRRRVIEDKFGHNTPVQELWRNFQIFSGKPDFFTHTLEKLTDDNIATKVTKASTMY